MNKKSTATTKRAGDNKLRKKPAAEGASPANLTPKRQTGPSPINPS